MAPSMSLAAAHMHRERHLSPSLSPSLPLSPSLSSSSIDESPRAEAPGARGGEGEGVRAGQGEGVKRPVVWGDDGSSHASDAQKRDEPTVGEGTNSPAGMWGAAAAGEGAATSEMEGWGVHSLGAALGADAVNRKPNPLHFFFFFFFTLVTGPRRSLSLTLSDTRVNEPQILHALHPDPDP